jgi:branched-chain amino acid transport system permease protein
MKIMFDINEATIHYLVLSCLNGASFGLLLFLISSGLTVIYSLMGILNFAHTSFYMLGAYIGYTLSQYCGFFMALLIAPLLVALLGALTEYYALRHLKKISHTLNLGHIPELLFTFGLSYILLEMVQLFWGRNALILNPPDFLDGTAFSVFGIDFPRYKLFIMLVSMSVLLALYGLFKSTKIGLILQASLTHGDILQTLGHNVPRLLTGVFATGTGLAGLAGVMAAPILILDPMMANTIGSMVFIVIVIGGLGSITGAFIASILLACLQTFAVGMDFVLFNYFKLSQLAPILPYVLLIFVLLFKPAGLLGNRK